MHRKDKSDREATLILKTSPRLGFRLNLSPREAIPIQSAVRDKSTFIWDKLDVVECTLPSSIAYPLPLQPRVVTLSELLLG